MPCLPKPEHCHACRGWEWGGIGFVPASGSGSLGLLVVGEAAGEAEAREGRPFVEYAPAGSMLERMLKRAVVSRDQLRIHNVISCRPEKNWLEGAPWENAVVTHCSPLLDETIREMKPKCILALGNSALKRLTPYGGKGATVTAVRGYILKSDYHIPVIATYHPSYLVRGKQAYCGVFIHDLQKALQVAQARPDPQPHVYVPRPDAEDAEVFVGGVRDHHIISYDIETPYSAGLDEEETEEKDESYTIIRISFCYEEGRAISFPWQEPFISYAKRLLALPNAKRVWNGAFDNPRLIHNCAPIAGKIEDVMWAWHTLQPALPRNLQFVASFYTDGGPWKHLAMSEPEFYSCEDAGRLHTIGEGVERDLRKLGMYDIHQRHVVNLSPILQQMAANGLPIDPQQRLTFKAELETRYDARFAKLQECIPDEVKPVHPRGGYKKTPPPVRDALDAYHNLGLMANPSSPLVGETKEAYVRRRVGFRCISVDGEQRWGRVEPFLPKSWQQVLAYIKHHKHAVPRPKKKMTSESTETTESDALLKLYRRTKDETYKLIVECRQLKDVLGRYANKWVPGADGRIHPTPGFWGAMHRISWRNPNAAATIQDKDSDAQIAAGFRKCIVAPSGYVLLETDWRGMEAVLVGYFSGDAAYQRLAALGIHSYLASHILGEPADLSMSDVDLAAYFKLIKARDRKLYDDAKHITYLSQYGGGPKHAADMYDLPYAFTKKLQGVLRELFPKVYGPHGWQHRTIEQAHNQAYLVNPWGYRMWFWDVLHWDAKQRRMVLGEDAKSALAFLPRDSGAAVLKDVLLNLHELAEAGILLLSTHDALLNLVRETSLAQVMQQVRDAMEAPITALGGLVIRTESKVGKSWHDSEMKLYAI